MKTRFDVYDEWGNFLGTFTRAGSATDNIAVLIAFVIIGVILSVIYMLIRLIIEGFRALTEGRLDKALGYWAIPLLLVAGILYANINKSLETKKENTRLSQLEQSITIDYQLGSCQDVNPDESFVDNRCFVSFTVTSKYSETLHIWLTDRFDYECDNIDVYGTTLGAREIRHFVCTVPTEEELVTHITDSYDGIDDISLCLDVTKETELGKQASTVCPNK
jgi:hypothetical protein